MNILDYIDWRGDLTFSQSSFNKIDALIFSQLSYLNLTNIISQDFTNAITFEKLAKLFNNSPDYEKRKYSGLMINKDLPVLLNKCAESNRFKNCKICGFKEILNEEITEQFAAVTIILPDNKIIIAYRGTDDTLIGWKEDFNIAYQSPIPSQTDALLYLNEVNKYYKKNYYIVGHSKGGNEAVYVSANCTNKIQKKIKAVYNFDGPGFSQEFYKSEKYLSIKNRLFSFYPYFSIVGMIFYHPKEFEIVKSEGFAIYQHDCFNWQVCATDFLHEDDFSDNSKFFYTTFNKWVENLSHDDIQKFVTALFDVISASGAKTNTELNDNKITASKNMLSAYVALDSRTKEKVHEIIKILLKAAQSEIFLLNLLDF